MKVKRYTGNSLEKIRDVIVKELGTNAVVVNIKKSQDKKGLLGKKVVSYEVIAAVDDVAVDAEKAALNVNKLTTHAYQEIIEAQKLQYRGIRQSMKLIDEKLAALDEWMDKVGSPSNLVAGKSTINELINVHDDWQHILTEIVSKSVKNNTPTPEDWHEALASIVPTAGGIMFRKTPAAPPDVYVMLGPTGVGKTTTLAKLAAKCVLGESLNVGLITMDTFRVAAVDQLREYASLLGVELEVAFSSAELDQQLKAFYDKDIVFIDTPGRSQFDTIGIEGIKENLENVSGLCSILVVAANVRAEDAVTIYDSYSLLNPAAVVISKTDEATRCDGITTLLDVSGLPVIYLADGQRVPEDLHIASPGLVASMVMPFVKSEDGVKIGEGANNA
jgi:flagellar biosynthesis protein FlhF